MLKIFLNIVLGIILGRVKAFALQTIERLDATTLTNEEKRTEAFKLIKAEGISEGKSLRDSLINLAIEAAVTWLKK